MIVLEGRPMVALYDLRNVAVEGFAYRIIYLAILSDAFCHALGQIMASPMSGMV
jgi:hypothetical protein